DPYVRTEAVERAIGIARVHGDRVATRDQPPYQIASNETRRAADEYVARPRSASKRVHGFRDTIPDGGAIPRRGAIADRRAIPGDWFTHPFRRPPMMKHGERIPNRPREYPYREHREEPR